MSKKKYPYAYKDSKGKDRFVFLGTDGYVYERVIPKQGMARYFFDNGEFGKLEYMFKNEARENERYSAIMSEEMRRKQREKYFAKRESKYITDNRAEVNHMED